MEEFQQHPFERFEMRNLGELEWFLGIHITRDRNVSKLWLCQDSYIDKIVAKFHISLDGKAPSTPLSAYLDGPYSTGPGLIKYDGHATAQEIQAYQQRVGSINFAAVITRPDVAQAASKLSEFLTNPSKFHMESANRTLKYLGHTKHLAIEFNATSDSDRNTTFLASSDASFANDVLTRYRSQG